MRYRLKREERETHYYINDAENIWYADSYIPRDINRLKKQGWTLIDEDYYEDGTIAYARFTAPRFALSIRKPVKSKREMSEEHKLALMEGLIKYQKKQVEET